MVIVGVTIVNVFFRLVTIVVVAPAVVVAVVIVIAFVAVSAVVVIALVAVTVVLLMLLSLLLFLFLCSRRCNLKTTSLLSKSHQSSSPLQRSLEFVRPCYPMYVFLWDTPTEDSHVGVIRIRVKQPGPGGCRVSIRFQHNAVNLQSFWFPSGGF